MKRKARILSLLLALVLCFSSIGLTAFAMGDDPDYTVVIPGETRPPSTTTPQPTRPAATTPTTPTETKPQATEPTKPPKGTGFTEDGILATRDLLYDKATNKQYIVVETRTGETFYMVIDYDKPLDEDEERYQTYFLNPVDVADLMAMMGVEEETKPAVCSCTDRCVIGAINMNCELCTQNVGRCVGKVPETTAPPTTEPPAPQKSSNGNPGAVLAILLLLGGGGAYGYYTFVKKKSEDKKNGNTDLNDYDYGMDDEEMQEFEPSDEAEDD